MLSHKPHSGLDLLQTDMPIADVDNADPTLAGAGNRTGVFALRANTPRRLQSGASDYAKWIVWLISQNPELIPAGLNAFGG